jgi:hypothetical protein
MVDRGLISEFERSLSSQEGPVWFPLRPVCGLPNSATGCQLCFNDVSVKPAA